MAAYEELRKRHEAFLFSKSKEVVDARDEIRQLKLELAEATSRIAELTQENDHLRSKHVVLLQELDKRKEVPQAPTISVKDGDDAQRLQSHVSRLYEYLRRQTPQVIASALSASPASTPSDTDETVAQLRRQLSNTKSARYFEMLVARQLQDEDATQRQAEIESAFSNMAKVEGVSCTKCKQLHRLVRLLVDAVKSDAPQSIEHLVFQTVLEPLTLPYSDICDVSWPPWRHILYKMNCAFTVVLTILRTLVLRCLTTPHTTYVSDIDQRLCDFLINMPNEPETDILLFYDKILRSQPPLSVYREPGYNAASGEANI
jgi:hypothetical protein